MRKQALTVVALTAALALGTAPAFATPGVGDSTDRTLDNKGNTGTTVKVETTVDQIVASLPIDMTIAVHTKGGAADAPSEDAYKILNKSIFPIKVSAATATAHSDWNLVAEKQAEGSSPAVSAVAGNLQILMTPKAGSPWNVAEAYTADGWKIDARTVSGETVTDGVLAVKVEATSSKLKKTFSSATKAVTLTYTIAADDVAAVPVS